MNDTRTDKVTENRLRRAAARQGLTLSRNRARDVRALDYGTYGLSDATTNSLVAGNPGTGYGLTLEQVEAALNEPRPR